MPHDSRTKISQKSYCFFRDFYTKKNHYINPLTPHINVGCYDNNIIINTCYQLLLQFAPSKSSRLVNEQPTLCFKGVTFCPTPPLFYGQVFFKDITCPEKKPSPKEKLVLLMVMVLPRMFSLCVQANGRKIINIIIWLMIASNWAFQSFCSFTE